MARLGVSGLPHLRGTAFGKGNSEEPEEITVGCFHINVRFDEGLPFANQRTEFVGSKIHPMEIGEAVLALDLVDAELDFAK